MKKLNYNLDDLLTKINEDTNIPVITATGGSNSYSFGVVNNINGKRLTFSKALTKVLELGEDVVFAPSPEDGILMVAKELPSGRASTGKLKGGDKKTCYRAELVKLIVECFNLDYSDRTSLSFNNIKIDERDDIKIALIDMTTARVEKEVKADAV